MSSGGGPSLARRVRWGAELALQYSGLASWYARGRGAGAVILMYHSVTPQSLVPFVDRRVRTSPERFARQMSLIAAARSALGMSELVERWRERKIPYGSVVITFDDGYLDTLTTALPVLERFRLPAVVYLPTEYINTGEPQWVDRLYTAFHHRRKGRLELPDGNVVDLSHELGRGHARSVLEPMLTAANMERRRELLSDVERQLAPRVRAPRLTLTWDDVRTLMRRYPQVELGNHTAEHTDVTERELRDVEHEITRAQQTAVQELGQPFRHFSFPYSRDNVATRALVRRLGFESAVGSGDRYLIDEHSDLHYMSRIEPGNSIAMLRFWTSGAYPELSQAIWGHA